MKFRSIGALALAVASALTLAACNDSSSGDGGGASGPANVAFVLTDAPSEQIVSFTVDLSDLQMRRANGTLVDALDQPARVDLATLSDLSEIVDQGELPNGAYTQMQITLDFANAEVVLANQTSPATVLDSDGQPLNGVQTLTIDFQTGPFIVVAAHQHVVELDFALDQSVIVDAPGNSVTVEPMFTVQVDQAGPKDLIAFGRLAALDVTAGTFTVQVETLNGIALSEVEFLGDTSTVYQVDGVPYSGATGFAALTALPINAWVQARGKVVGQSSKIHALYVEAGTGTYNGGQAIVDGFVVDRTGGAGMDATLTVFGRSSNAMHTSFQFATSFTVDASLANTHVVRLGSATPFDVDDVNVGQEIRAYGALTGTTLNASGGVIRMLPTAVFGYASGAANGGVLTLDLDRVGYLNETSFNWSAVGTSPVDSDVFEAQVGTLDQGLGIGAATPVAVRGYFTSVDDDTEDFDALTLTNLENAPALLVVRNLAGGFDVMTTTSMNDIVFDITGTAGTGEFALLDTLFVGSTPLPTSPSPTIEPVTNGHGLFFLKDKDTGQATFYKLFHHFSAALETELGQGAMLSWFAASGAYDAPSNTLTATVIVATIE